MYRCSCGKDYKRLRPFQEHRAFCEILKTCKNESIEHLQDTPSHIDMWLAMKTLIKKNEKLENDVKILTQWIKKQKKKLSLVDWLNDNFKLCKNGLDIIKESELNEEDLHMVFQNNFIEGMVHILYRLINEHQEKAIKAFDQKLNTLFIYSNSGWKLLDNDELKDIINIIHRKLQIQLINYTKKHERQFNDLSRNDSWYKNISKVMGCGSNNNSHIKKIGFKLYNRIRYNLKNIIQYEFTF
jgi:hypothetical protein